ncbi:MAG TPA: cyclic peptide export ABC transporter [Candidatus Polarisedimenticolia bacterium]|jgi:putative ATP-binding cassette transporter|nr:cyclic peptide export ABC transporter [Candidatus Polarisedimenticolia bacterium]
MRRVIQFFLTSSFTGRSTKVLLATAISLSLLGGAANVALLALVTRRLSGDSSATWTFIAALLGLGALLGITRGAAQYLLTKVTIDTLVALRTAFCKEVTAAPLAVLEHLGSARLTAAFTENMPAISNALVQLPNVILYAIVAGGSIVYMGWLSWLALMLILAAGAIFLVSYRVVNHRAQAEFGKAFVHYRALLKGFRELVDGAKELKLHRQRRQAHLASAIGAPLNGLARHRIKSSFLYGAAEAWSTTGMFFGIAMVLMFAQGKREIGTGFVVALLYLMPFVQGILSTMPAFSQAEMAVKAVQELIGTLSQSSDVTDTDTQSANRWYQISLENVTYRYDSGDPDSSFQIGPMDFSMTAGEVIFVTGGNGSGKTTFIKVLAGLYYPQAGTILVDGAPVAAAGIDRYRQRFSSVFFDFHLFDQLYGMPDIDEKAALYLKHLKLDHKVSVNDGKLSTTNLSQGQRKRLALLTAYLEDRPIYIFDEWAADQDLEFREFFYYEIIPGLKRRNKTVIVISHDERYFHLADRVVKLELGHVVQEIDKQKLEKTSALV